MIATMPVIEDQGEPNGIDITAITKLKHADLWRAAKKLGSQSALARYLGVTPQDIGAWINLKAVPCFVSPNRSSKWTDEYITELERKLLELTGKTLDELFPEEFRDNVLFLHAPKTFERTAKVRANALEHYAAATTERLSRVNTDLESLELKQDLKQVLKTLSYREREIINLRYGLDSGDSHTLEEVGHVFRVCRDRIRQIEAKAIRKLQQPEKAKMLVGHLPS